MCRNSNVCLESVAYFACLSGADGAVGTGRGPGRDVASGHPGQLGHWRHSDDELQWRRLFHKAFYTKFVVCSM